MSESCQLKERTVPVEPVWYWRQPVGGRESDPHSNWLTNRFHVRLVDPVSVNTSSALLQRSLMTCGERENSLV